MIPFIERSNWFHVSEYTAVAPSGFPAKCDQTERIIDYKSKSIFLLQKQSIQWGGREKVSSFQKISVSCIIDAKMIR